MNHHARGAATWLLFLFLASCSGCAGTAARNTTLLPTMRLAWIDIKTQAERQAPFSPTPPAMLSLIADAERALNVSEVPETAIASVDWGPILQLARDDTARRVEAEEIGPGVGVSLDERVKRFEEALNKYLRRQ